MMALALLVIVRVLPELAKVALPEPTVPPVGLAKLCPLERLKQAATESAISLGLKSPRCLRLALELDMATPPIDFIPSANFVPAANGKLILDPELAMVALPELTVPPVGLAKLCPLERLKQ